MPSFQPSHVPRFIPLGKVRKKDKAAVSAATSPFLPSRQESARSAKARVKAAAAVSGVGFHALLTFVVPLQLLNAGFSNLTAYFERKMNHHNLFI